MAKKTGEFYKAIDGFAVSGKGAPRVIHVDEVVSESDPILKTHRHLFVALSDELAAGVERATAAPGESRAVGTQAGREALAKAGD